MSTIKFVYYKYMERGFSVSKYLEEQNTYFFNKSEKIDNRFCEVFYSCITSSVSLDLYELFTQIDILDKPFYKNIYEININDLKTLYKWIAIHHTIKFSDNIKNDNIIKSMENNLYFMYNLNEQEKILFKELIVLNKKDEVLFQISFTKNISRYAFGIEYESLLVLSFIYNFLYNSYNNFIKCYTKYIDIESWLKYA